MIAFNNIKLANSTIRFDLFDKIFARIQEETLLIACKYKKRLYNAIRIDYR